MRRIWIAPAVALALTACAHRSPESSPAASAGPYTVLKTRKVGGAGGFDYVYADVAARRLYIPRSGNPGARVTVFDLDSFDSLGVIANTNARGAAVDPRSNHGFASSKPVAMWDSKTLAPIKTIDVQGGPDGILFDRFNGRTWVFSHSAPNATVIDAATGSVVGTVDLGGAPEQAVTDGKGRIYVDIEDRDSVAVIDAKTLTVLKKYSLGGKGGTPAGLAFDVKNDILFVACRNPATMVIMSAKDGHIISTLPIGNGTDGAVFNPATNEAFSSNGDGTLTIIREVSPTEFVIAQTVPTTRGAKTLTLDTRTNRIVLIAAEYGPTPPPPTDGSRPARAPMIPGSFAIWLVGR
jgi:DNA-binding beta-propeller fold protein YncE